MSRRLFFLSLSVVSLFACGPTEEVTSAEDADDSAASTTSESALTTELSDEVTQPVSMTGAELAQAAATRVGSHLHPAGCMTSVVTGATVTYTLTDCTGPYGLVHVTGVLTALYSRGAGGSVQAVITGSNVKVNNSTLDLNSTVTASIANGVRKASVASDSSGTGPRGGALSRKGAYTTTWDPETSCVTLDGTWETKAGVRTASTVVANYKRCKGTCPAAGGSIVHTTAKSAVVTLTYDGSAKASWVTSTGRTGTVTLTCTP